MLPVFLNYFPEVQEKWLEEAGISKADISKIKALVFGYAKEKVALENKSLPKTKGDMIAFEDNILKKMFVGKIFRTSEEPGKVRKVIENLLKQQYSGAAIITPEELAKIEKFTLFHKEKRKFLIVYLVFDPENMKIIGIEIAKK